MLIVEASIFRTSEPWKNVLNLHLLWLTSHCQQEFHTWLQRTFCCLPNQVYLQWMKELTPLEKSMCDSLTLLRIQAVLFGSRIFLACISLNIASTPFSLFLLPRTPVRQILGLRDPSFMFLTCSFILPTSFTFLCCILGLCLDWISQRFKCYLAFQFFCLDFYFKNKNINVHYLLIFLWTQYLLVSLRLSVHYIR